MFTGDFIIVSQQQLLDTLLTSTVPKIFQHMVGQKKIETCLVLLGPLGQLLHMQLIN